VSRVPWLGQQRADPWQREVGKSTRGVVCLNAETMVGACVLDPRLYHRRIGWLSGGGGSVQAIDEKSGRDWESRLAVLWSPGWRPIDQFAQRTHLHCGGTRCGSQSRRQSEVPG